MLLLCTRYLWLPKFLAEVAYSFSSSEITQLLLYQEVFIVTNSKYIIFLFRAFLSVTGPSKSAFLFD